MRHSISGFRNSRRIVPPCPYCAPDFCLINNFAYTSFGGRGVPGKRNDWRSEAASQSPQYRVMGVSRVDKTPEKNEPFLVSVRLMWNGSCSKTSKIACEQLRGRRFWYSRKVR